jgi:two-component system, NtrC family, response regulator GlrR
MVPAMGCNESTLLGSSSQRYEEVLLRQHPHLTWSDSEGSHSAVVTGPMVVGTAGAVDLVLREPTVSRLHAELEPRESGLWLRDLGSRNGSFIDGVRVERGCVPERGRIRLGALELAVRYGSQPAPVALWADARFGPLLGASTPMRELFARLERIAASDATVLMQGETGTGKELVARALHDASARAGGPFVIVDCGALPESLLDAELFGHSRGAFTGAVGSRAGAFEAADGGTLFLDEIGELPLPLQPKLLRILEARTVRRLGENEARAVDVRFISATNRDLRTMVNARAFREDLYFRLAVLPVTVPPLREHASDIALLAEHFLPPASRALLTPALISELESRPWLGNVRELRNFIDRLTALGEGDALAAPHQGDAAEPSSAGGSRRLLPTEWLNLPLREARDRCTQQMEREYLGALLQRHDHNVTAAAQSAGVDRTYLHRLVRKYGI